MSDASRVARPRLRRGPWYGEFGQDRFLDRHVFGGARAGVFVEAGAYDGVTGSNTLFFERFRGWRGLLVEPSPRLAALARGRRRAPVHEVALAAATGRGRFVEVVSGYRMMSGLESTYPPSMLRAVRARRDHREALLHVPTRTLQDLLAEAGLGEVDLVSLDLEGGELAVLENFPFRRFHVRAWCVENREDGGTV